MNVPVQIHGELNLNRAQVWRHLYKVIKEGNIKFYGPKKLWSRVFERVRGDTFAGFG